MRKNRVIALGITALLMTGCASTGDSFTTRQKDLLTYGALTLADAGIVYVGMNEGATEMNPLHTLGGDDAVVVALSVAVTGAVFAYLMDRLTRASGRGHDHSAWKKLNILRGAVAAWDVAQIAKLREENEK